MASTALENREKKLDECAETIEKVRICTLPKLLLESGLVEY